MKNAPNKIRRNNTDAYFLPRMIFAIV